MSHDPSNIWRRIRRDLDLSQRALAVELGTTQATVSRWESGELVPTVRQVAALRRLVIRRRLNWDDQAVFRAVTPVAA